MGAIGKGRAQKGMDRGSPALMRRINIRQILDAMRDLGPCSRVDLTQHTGLSAPTVSKLMEELLRRKLVETLEVDRPVATGRPSVIYRLAREKIQFVGVVVDIDRCRVVSAGLDGQVESERSLLFETPSSYAALIRAVAREVKKVVAMHPGDVLGVGMSVPGLLDREEGRQIFSPNLHFMDGRYPAADLAESTGFTVVAVQEEQGLCLAEQLFGQARDMQDFAMIDISAGLGMGVISGGRFIGGASGFAGELGHVTVEPGGLLCGCGNRGCLETVASDTAFLRAINERKVVAADFDELIALVEAGRLRVDRDLTRALNALAIGVGMVINLFNPSHLFLYGRLFDVKEDAFATLVEQTRQHTIQPSMQDVKLVRARGSKRLGALAAIIEQYTGHIAPRLR